MVGFDQAGVEPDGGEVAAALGLLIAGDASSLEQAVLAATGLVGLGLPEVVLTIVLAALALASLITVVQRILEVRRQAFAVEPRA